MLIGVLMSLSHTPLLQIQRDLFNLPRGWVRFERYLERMIGGTQEMILPLAVLNPMGKAHVARKLDRLLELNAESIAAEAIEEAVERLKPIPEGSAIHLLSLMMRKAAGRIVISPTCLTALTLALMRSEAGPSP